ncbi:MAG: polysaccharide deacetylase family protein [Thermoguttaceae bacterium]|jgi:peptidoglycan/xylan/chitin deacetylase (PgdA/CDA1 family)
MRLNVGFKKKVASLIGACGGAFLAECLPHSTRVLFYHGVKKGPIVHPVVEADQITFDAFRKQIDFFAKRYRFLSPDEFYERFMQRKFSKKELLLTFDDGYANTAEVVAPYLIEKNIPFLVFISPHLTETNQRTPSYYTFVAAYDPNLTKLDVESVKKTFPLNSDRDRYNTAMELLTYVRSLNEDDLIVFLKEVEENSSKEYREEAWEKYSSTGLMSWEQAEALSREELAVVGSHCWRHSILHAGQSDEEVVRQLRDSHDAIVQHCGKCDYFSYPNGGRDYVSAFAEEKSKDYYKMSFGVTRTQVKPTDVASFVSRIGLFGDFNGVKTTFSLVSLK